MVGPAPSVWFLILILLASTRGASGQQPSENVEKKTIRFLALVQWRDEFNRPHSGWDTGPDMLAAGRVAVQEINERPDLLSDYTIEMIEGQHEACGLTEANLGLRELAHKGTNESVSIVAVLGLFCSTSTKVIAPVAGRIGIIQLSAANSPLFSRNIQQFPHLWRILVSAEAYAGMMLSLMKHYGWNKVGVVQDLDTIFHSGIAESFIEMIKDHNNYIINYHGGLIQTRQDIIDLSLDNIKLTGTRIIFLQTTGPQTTAFLCAAARKNMVYPDYLWIITDYFLTGLIGELQGLSDCNEELLRKGINGSLIGFFDLEDTNATFTNASGLHYSNYQRKYFERLNETRSEYYSSGDDLGDVLYAGLLYDQVWALALALDDAVTRHNVSLHDYDYSQYGVTDIIEESLSRVSFKGATGHIMFSKEREVSTPVSIYQVNSMSADPHLLIGYYDSQYRIINISNPVSLPNDNIETNVQPLPLPAAVVLYVATVVVILIVTIILSCLLYQRSKPQIKASSPLFSSLMFIGCYLLCLTCLIRLTYATFSPSDIPYQVLCNTQSAFFFNGTSLVFVTLFIRLLRIKRIFYNKRLSKYLGCFWTNKVLTVVVIVITILPNIILAAWIGLDRLQKKTLVRTLSDKPLLYNEEQHWCSCEYMLVWYGLAFLYLLSILLSIVILAAHMRHIKHKDFKDTKKVNAFIFLFVLTLSLVASALWIFPEIQEVSIGHIIIITGLLVMVIECQVMIFLPKIITFKRTKHTRTRQYSVTDNIITLFSWDKS